MKCSTAVPLDLQEFLSRDTEYGCKVKDLQPKNGTYLIWKIPMSEESSGKQGAKIYLAPQFRRRQVRNLVSILGFVVSVSEPFRMLHSRKKWVSLPEAEAAKDGLPGTIRPRYTVRHGVVTNPQVKAGDCVVYSSYNLGRVNVIGLDEPLVVVREIDVLARFPVEKIEDYELADFALTRSHVG